MALFDRLTTLAKNAVEMTSDVFESGSINAKISAEKGKVSELKQRIGEYYWAQYAQGNAIDEEPGALCAEIQAAEQRIEALRAEQQAAKAAGSAQAAHPMSGEGDAQDSFCDACGAANAPGAKFCRECGGRLAGHTARCDCGEQIPVGCKFCPGCGAPVER